MNFYSTTKDLVNGRLICSQFAVSFWFKEFFDLESEIKNKYANPSIGGARGYTPFGKETALGESVPDLKEFWHHGPQINETFDKRIHKNITIDEVLSPFEAFAHLTEMKYLSPFITYGVPNPKLLNIKMSTVEMNKRHQQIELRGDELVNLIQNLLVNRN